MAIDEKLLEDLKQAVRTKAKSANDEIGDLAEACRMDLIIKGGVYVPEDFSDPLAKQALKLYCKGYYGYDKDQEKFRAAYAALRDSMALSGDYRKADTDG